MIIATFEMFDCVYIELHFFQVFGMLLQVLDSVCTTKFLITLMTSDGNLKKNETVKHQPGSALADFNITLTADVDICSLLVFFITGNSVGISPPTNFTVGL